MTFRPSTVPYDDIQPGQTLLLRVGDARLAASYANATRRGERWRARSLGRGVVVNGVPAANLERVR